MKAYCLFDWAYSLALSNMTQKHLAKIDRKPNEKACLLSHNDIGTDYETDSHW